MKRELLFILLAIPWSFTALAQVQIQPIEIVTSAPLNSFSERSGSWPVTVSPEDVIPSETESLNNYLNTLPGVQSRETGSPTISIRGSTQSGRVLSLFDGVPLNFADGFGMPPLLVPNEILGELRLIKGPAAVFYGASAMAGAINFIPRVFDDPAVRLTIGQDDGAELKYGALGVFTLRTNKDKDDFLQVSAYADTNPGDFDFTSTSSGISSSRSGNNSKTKRATMLGQQSWGSWQVRERAIVGEEKGNTPGPVSAPSVSTFTNTAALASVDAKLRLSSAADISLMSSGIWQNFLYDQATSFETKSQAAKYALTGDFGYVFSGGYVSRSFVDLLHDQLKTEGLDSGNVRVQQRYNEDTVEIGEIIEIPIYEQWTLQPGARWLAEFDRLVKSLGLIHDRDRDRAWLTYGEGYRAPSLLDRYSDVSYFIGNPNLTPESSSQIELGYLRKPAKQHSTYAEGLSWSTSLYSIDYKNVFDNEPVSATQSTRVNRGDAYAYGGEAGFAWAATGWTVAFTYNRLEGKNRQTNEPLPLSPRDQITATGTLHLGPIVVEIKDSYWSSYYDREFPSNTLRELPDWNVVDLNLRSIGFMSWELKAGVLNIFNEPRELTVGFPEPQRSYYVSAQRNF